MPSTILKEANSAKVIFKEPGAIWPHAGFQGTPHALMQVFCQGSPIQEFRLSVL